MSAHPALRESNERWTERAESAANYLAETDRKFAELRTKWERDKRKAKQVWSALFLRLDGTVEARKAAAEIHEAYQEAQAAELTSLQEYESLKNERETANIVIDFWRSYNKATQMGVV